ncbi:MAG: M48 family metalloprotease, partial [Deltaproteobacteria bacterium]|nr:M48 family metalloprotease [Deltaproteobacteria bacterium]
MDFIVSIFAVSTAQAFFLALFTEALLKVWKVRLHSQRILFHAAAFIVPPAIMPFNVYRILSGDESAFDFHILDVQPWLNLAIYQGITMSHVLLFFCAISLILFAVQEIPPFIAHIRGVLSIDRSAAGKQESSAEAEGVINCIASEFPYKINILDDAAAAVYAAGLFAPEIVIDRPVLSRLTTGELRLVMMHEAAHIIRRDNLWGLALFSLRVILFFNPVSMVLFRRIIQENEIACDEYALKRSDGREDLINGIEKLYSHETVAGSIPGEGNYGWLSHKTAALDNFSSYSGIIERIEKIRKMSGFIPVDLLLFRLLLALVSLAGIAI